MAAILKSFWRYQKVGLVSEKVSLILFWTIQKITKFLGADLEYGLIGEKLGHSYSKEIHAEIGDYSYELKEIPKEELEAFIKERNFIIKIQNLEIKIINF